MKALSILIGFAVLLGAGYASAATMSSGRPAAVASVVCGTIGFPLTDDCACMLRLGGDARQA